MSEACCIIVAYSELHMRKTLKPFKSVLFSCSFGILQSVHVLLILWFCVADVPES